MFQRIEPSSGQTQNTVPVHSVHTLWDPILFTKLY